MSFSDIAGHRHSVEVLKKAILRNRLHHAYIFHGLAGVGKELTALSLAKAVNCREMEGDFCGTCISCRKIDSLNHPDLIIIRPQDGSIKIDQMRDVQKELQYQPFEGLKRLIIIDSADSMVTHAANSLLKTLEEPPSDTIIILIAVNINSILPTLRSRCQILRFSALSTKLIESMLIERKKVEPSAARLIAALSEGSLGKALNEDESAPVRLRERIFSDFTRVKERGIMHLFKLSEGLAKSDELDPLLNALKIIYRDMAVIRSGSNALINIDERERIKGLARTSRMEDILEGFFLIAEMEDMKKRNINTQLALEATLMRINV